MSVYRVIFAAYVLLVFKATMHGKLSSPLEPMSKASPDNEGAFDQLHDEVSRSSFTVSRNTRMTVATAALVRRARSRSRSDSVTSRGRGYSM